MIWIKSLFHELIRSFCYATHTHYTSTPIILSSFDKLLQFFVCDVEGIQRVEWTDDGRVSVVLVPLSGEVSSNTKKTNSEKVGNKLPLPRPPGCINIHT